MKITQVDAFTDRPFAGNPAAVCLLDAPGETSWMQLVAREMNLSETAFLVPADAGEYRLRWFTPAVEVDLCGHATLAAAHVLWEDGHLPGDRPAVFRTRSGRLTATRQADGWIALDFPAEPVAEAEPPADLAAGLGGERFRYVGRNRMDLLVELESEEDVRALRPDFGRLAAIPARGIIVTARSSDPEFDLVSRFFAPQSGVPEDPVTGSAHCALVPFWRERLGGKDELRARQVSARGGVLRLRAAGDRVSIAGQAVTVLRGELLVPDPPADLSSWPG